MEKIIKASSNESDLVMMLIVVAEQRLRLLNVLSANGSESTLPINLSHCS